MTGWRRQGVALFLLLIALAAAAGGSGGLNAPGQRQKPYLILVSIDGLGHDLPGRTATPALDRLATEGLRAAALVPVYPTLTFPNHYSIATGLYPAQHGIVANYFRGVDGRGWYRMSDRSTVQDGSWYGGEPIWVAAEKAGMVSAAFFFVGTEADIQGISPTYWYPFDASVPGEARVDQVLDWLRMPPDTRPHLVTLYFEDVDVTAHATGPGSRQTLAAVRRVDGYLGRLLDGIDRLPYGERVHLVVVSDHGQRAVLPDAATFVVSDHAHLDGLDMHDGGSYLQVWVRDGGQSRAREFRDRVNAVWRHGRAWLRDESPSHWRVTDDPRFADVVLMAEPGHTVVSRPEQAARLKAGKHGWDPLDPAMRGILFASGKSLPAGIEVGPVAAVDVYPLMLAILGLPDRRGGTDVTRSVQAVVSDWLAPGAGPAD
ncbi:MAG: ectonucleotide pyrophosphatase/phosphodiesterase [Gammaproteobacteria bacterium]